jgi:hypothetical protein
MPHFILPVNNPGGVLIPISVGVSVSRALALQNLSQPIPPPIIVQGLLDTGASGVCIDPIIVQKLSLQATGICNMITPSTGPIAQIVPEYDISIKISHSGGSSLDFDSLPAMKASLSNQGFYVLLGRNILSRCLLIYDGVNNSFTLAF